MSEFPDFSQYGYRVIKELGYNFQSGRVTYRAINYRTEQDVVIKQFQFATAKNAQWSGYKAIEQEISILRSLEHPGIPKYLESIETATGFCIVQAFIDAPNLAENRTFHPDEIKIIALKVLDILVYLQNRIPYITHRDIKPENILVDDRLDTYLIDFGLSIIGSRELGGTTMQGGTFGFIPREQIFQRSLNKASDLYALGATLICLLTGIKTRDFNKFVDEDFQINFKHRVPELSFLFIEWLEKMVAPRWQDRHPDAKTARKELEPLYIIRLPDVQLNTTKINLKATRLGQKIKDVIIVTNSVPETIIKGKWEIKEHPSDPVMDDNSHPWISITPHRFSSNNQKFQIIVDTRKLKANLKYKRTIILETNSLPKKQEIDISIKTAPVPIEKTNTPYLLFLGIFLLSSLLPFELKIYHNAIGWINNIIGN